MRRYGLNQNSDGDDNTATGAYALYNNMGPPPTGGINTGSDNTASGSQALFRNNNGDNNTASGFDALFSNTTGNNNVASGLGALYKNTTGGNNTASGLDALYGNTTGSYNVGVGSFAGFNLTGGSFNIDIGSTGQASDANTIRIGAQNQETATYIAGISGSSVTGADVVVNGSGRLGVMMSSARYKHDIHDMGAASRKLLKLRPVTFRYNDDPTGMLQYGLVAEEVAKVYPELVTHGPDGKPQTVRYATLSAMLLNELQQQTGEVRRLSEQMARQTEATDRRIAELEARHQRELRAIQAGLERRLSAGGHTCRYGASPMPVGF